MSESGYEYIENIVGRSTVIRLPVVDRTWTGVHGNDKPFMLYPGEVSKEYVDGHELHYTITNFGRVYSHKRKDFIKGINGIYMPTVFKKLFTDDELTGPFSEYNLHAMSPKSYYQEHKEQRCAYQKAYREANYEKVREGEKRSKAKAKANRTPEEEAEYKAKRAAAERVRRAANKAKNSESTSSSAYSSLSEDSSE